MAHSQAMPSSHSKNHYDQVAKGYEDAFFYAEGPYQNHLAKVISEHLRLYATPGKDNLRLVDIGGGTGNLTQVLHTSCGLSHSNLCVDPSQEMLQALDGNRQIVPLCADALSFARRKDISYERALLKEVVHHIPVGELPTIFQGQCL